MCLKKVKGTFFIFFETKIFFWRDSQFWYSTWFYFWRWIRLTSSLELFRSVKNHTHLTKYLLQITERKKGEAKQLIFFYDCLRRICNCTLLWRNDSEEEEQTSADSTCMWSMCCEAREIQTLLLGFDIARKRKGRPFENYYMSG